jgi:NADH-quinone oxidoreductase subunit M
VGASGVVLGAIYLLWMYQRVMQGPVQEPQTDGHAIHLTDLTRREVAVLVPVALVILWIGIYPKPFLDRTAASVTAASERVAAANAPLLASAR